MNALMSVSILSTRVLVLFALIIRNC